MCFLAAPPPENTQIPRTPDPWETGLGLGEVNDQMGCLANIVVGIVGALVGGFVMQSFGAQGVTGFNLPSLLVAVVGAVILLVNRGVVPAPESIINIDGWCERASTNHL